MSHPLLCPLIYRFIHSPTSPTLRPARWSPQTPHQAAGQPFKFTIPESLDRIKEEFQFLQAQYHRCVSRGARRMVAGSARCPLSLSPVEVAATAVLNTGVQAVACGVEKDLSFTLPPFLALPGQPLLLSPPPPIVSLLPFAAVPGSLFSCV